MARPPTALSRAFGSPWEVNATKVAAGLRGGLKSSFLPQPDCPLGDHQKASPELFPAAEDSCREPLFKGEGPLAQHSDTDRHGAHTGLLPLPVCAGQRRLPRESPLVMAVEEARVRALRGLRDSRTLSSSRCLAFSDGNVALLLSTTLN